MRRATPAVAVLPIILATLALGCGQAQPRWVKTVEVSGIIDHTHANQRFRDGRYIGLDVKSGGNVRFVVATGGVEGFTGPIHQPQFYYELLPVTQTLLSPPPVKMSVKVTTKSVNWPNDSKTYDLQPSTPLKPGKYRFLYDGAGSVQIDVYMKQ